VWISTLRARHEAASFGEMRSYLIEVYAPGSRAEFQAAVARLRKASKAMAREGAAVSYRRSLLVPEDETCFHILDGASKAVVAEAARRAAIDAPRVVEAVR
jgi:hypothetical protein